MTTPRERRNPRDPQLVVSGERYWAGAGATALVAALIGLLAVLVFERVFDIPLVVPPDIFGTDSDQAAYAIDAAILAVICAVILYLLIISTPRPRTFFGWIMALVMVAVGVAPFARTDELDRGLLSGLTNVVIVASIWSLLAAVAGRTVSAAPPPTGPPPGGYPPGASAGGYPPGGAVPGGATPGAYPPGGSGSTPPGIVPPGTRPGSPPGGPVGP